MRSKRAPIICGLVLLATYASQAFLDPWWFGVVIENRVFTSSVLQEVLTVLPFNWPFLIGGILLAREAEIDHAARWVLVMSAVGGLLYSRFVKLLPAENGSVSSDLDFYLRYVLPFLVAAVGFCFGCCWPRTRVAAAL